MPTATTALSPALSIMQSIVAEQARLQQTDQPDAIGNSPNVAVTPAYSTQATQKLNEFYFGDHEKVTEVQAKIFAYLAQYVGKQIDAVENTNADQPADGTSSAGIDLKNSLKAMDDDVRGGLQNTLSDFAEGKQSVQATAIKMFKTLDLDTLSKDSQIIRYLEQLIGFDLHGMNAEDILKSFVDPNGRESDKLRSIISNALAGEEGSKVMQRLDDASKGIRSVEETKRDNEDVKPYDEVDEETKEEDKEDIKTAKAFEALNQTKDFIDAMKEEDTAVAEAKAAIEAAKDASTPTETSATSASEEGSDDSDAAGDKDMDAGDPWGYQDSDEKAGTQYWQSGPLYL